MLRSCAVAAAMCGLITGVSAVGLGACSGGAGKGSAEPTPPGSKHKQIAPLAHRKQAKDSHKALILGTDSRGGSTEIPLIGKENKVTVDAMWVQLPGDDQTPTGGMSQVVLTTAPSKEGTVRVGMYEQFSGGLGSQWRAAVWLSSFLSASALGKDLTDFRFTAEAQGFIDGASAGGLIAAGFLATITGAKIDPEATMTGAVNPDGTVGPVGGIPQKFRYALDNGKKRVGYPVGLRYAEDIETGEKVDLVAIAREKGGEAYEIADIYDAYELMTGQTLPSAVPVEEREMAIEDSVAGALRDKYGEWRQLLAQEWSQITELTAAGKLPDALKAAATSADEAAKAAEAQMQQGLAAAAYRRIVDATVYAATATATWEVIESVRAGNLQAGIDKLDEFAKLAELTEAALRRVGELKPSTMGGHLLMLSAFQSAIAGWGFQVFGTQQLGEAKSFLQYLANADKEERDQVDDDRLAMSIGPALLAIARAAAHTRVAIDTLEVEGVESVNYMCSLPNARRLATSYSSAAAANLKYFESLLLGEGNQLGQAILLSREPDYLIAMMSFRLTQQPSGLPAKLKGEWGEKSLPWSLGTLAGSTLSYFKTALLISKAYSLQVESNFFTGQPHKVGQEKAFINMINTAERKAREHARSAKVATGSIPIQTRIHYQHARVLREGDLSDKLRALELFWESSVYAYTAIMLARN